MSTRFARMDADSGRQVLEASGYSEDEIDEVLGVH
jgi:hypothetical protein